MDVNQLIGRQVRVCAVDFGSPANAVIRSLDLDSNSLLLEFAQPVRIGAQSYLFAVARPRLKRDHLDTLLRDKLLGCALTCVPQERYDASNPFDLSWWRGGGAAIADVAL